MFNVINDKQVCPSETILQRTSVLLALIDCVIYKMLTVRILYHGEEKVALPSLI